VKAEAQEQEVQGNDVEGEGGGSILEVGNDFVV
jgi:hypothetical protein